jgi:hypothetical protein
MIWEKGFWRILLIYAGWVTYVNLFRYVLVSESCKTLFQHSLLVCRPSTNPYSGTDQATSWLLDTNSVYAFRVTTRTNDDLRLWKVRS